MKQNDFHETFPLCIIIIVFILKFKTSRSRVNFVNQYGLISLFSISLPPDGSFPMSQRSFPPSFWNSAYQPSVTASLSTALGASHSDLPFPGDPYSSASLHSHLHQAAPESWHPTHHHHHHPYPLGAQSSAYPRPSVHDMYGTHFDPRYSSLLVPSVRPHRLPPSTVPAPGPSPCDISKSDPASSAWTGPFTGTGSEMGQSLSLNVDAGEKR